jgi:hypothetical protein
VSVVDAQGNATGTAPIVFGPNAFTVTVHTPAMGGDDSYVNAAAIMGNQTGPTDCVPNGGFIGMRGLYLPLLLAQ